MATQKKRRRVTPTPVVAEPAPTPEAAAPEGVPPEAAPQASLPSQEALRGPLAEAKRAVEGLQPLKVWHGLGLAHLSARYFFWTTRGPHPFGWEGICVGHCQFQVALVSLASGGRCFGVSGGTFARCADPGL